MHPVALRKCLASTVECMQSVSAAAIACGIHLPVPDTAPVDLLVGEIVRERNQFKLVLSLARCGKIFLGRCEKAIDQPYLV